MPETPLNGHAMLDKMERALPELTDEELVEVLRELRALAVTFVRALDALAAHVAPLPQSRRERIARSGLQVIVEGRAEEVDDDGR